MFESIRKFFARPKNIPEPSAETTAQSWNQRLLPVKFRAKSMNTNDAQILRNIAMQGMIRVAIDTIKDSVRGLNYRIVNADPLDKKTYKQQRLALSNVIAHPNIIDDFDSILDKFLEDALVLDASVLNKVSSPNPLRPLFLYPIDAPTIKILEPFNYTDPNGMRYEQAQGVTARQFSAKEIGYMQLNHFTHNSFGLSPVRKIYNYFNFFIESNLSANDVASSDTAKFLINLGKTCDTNQMKEFRKYMQEIAGTGQIPIVAGDGVDSKQIGAINSDSLFIEWQKFLLTLTARGFNLPDSVLLPQPTNDRNTIDQQLEQIMRAAKPYALLFAKAINEHVINHLGYNMLKFEFIFEQTESQKKALSERIRGEYVDGLISHNQALIALGYEPVKDKYGDMTSLEKKSSLAKDYATQASNNDLQKSGKGGEET